MPFLAQTGHAVSSLPSPAWTYHASPHHARLRHEVLAEPFPASPCPGVLSVPCRSMLNRAEASHAMPNRAKPCLAQPRRDRDVEGTAKGDCRNLRGAAAHRRESPNVPTRGCVRLVALGSAPRSIRLATGFLSSSSISSRFSPSPFCSSMGLLLSQVSSSRTSQ